MTEGLSIAQAMEQLLFRSKRQEVSERSLWFVPRVLGWGSTNVKIGIAKGTVELVSCCIRRYGVEAGPCLVQTATYATSVYADKKGVGGRRLFRIACLYMTLFLLGSRMN